MEGIQFDEEAFLREAKGRLRFAFSHLVPPVLEGYDRLLEEPEEYQRRWTFDVDKLEHPARKTDPDDGLVARRGEKNVDPRQAAYDHKFFFHYSCRLPFLLRSSGVPIERHVPFLNACRELYDVCVLGLLEVAKALDARAGTTTYASCLRTTEHKLRLLRYEARPEGALIGKEHTDRSWLTVHLAETFPACYVEDQLIEAKPDDALVFGSDGVDRGIGGALPGVHACKHKIVVPPGSGWISEPRRSVVFFGRIDR